jgi:hypothetical protein
MLANFYYEASHTAVVIGAVAALGLVIALGLTKRVVFSTVCGTLGWGLIAFCVWACGHGDVVGLFYLVIAVPLAAIIGGFAGLISASVMRGAQEPAEPKPKEPQDKLPDAS